MLEDLRKLSQHFLAIKNQTYQRYLLKEALLSQRLSIIIGQRGVGKTTVLIQHLLDQVNNDVFSQDILYIQADHFLLGDTSLYNIAEQFNELGGKWLAFDEIHKYSDWSKELKSIYDTFPQLKIIASGSSALEIHKGSHDLTRRAIIYKLNGLSFREYLELYYSVEIPCLSLTDILKNHQSIAANIIQIITKTNKKIIPHFQSYLKEGYYPYLQEINDVALYYLTIEQNVRTSIESDLVAIHPSLTGTSVKKILQLLSFISRAVPFTPNWTKLKSILAIGDERTLKNYCNYIEDAGLIQTLSSSSKKLNRLETVEKIYLNNPNQMFALAFDNANTGTVRETFFLNMLKHTHDVSLPQQGDFLVDDKYLFEVGGRNKKDDQVRKSQHAYLALDEIESGINNKIPLWMMGLLY